MISFYRIEFYRGPYDGLVVEETAMLAPRLRLPVGSAESGPLPAAQAPVYQLSAKALNWNEGVPQAVLRYEFQGNMTEADAGIQPSATRRAFHWLASGRRRLKSWMMTPVGYPMSTRDVR